jgi:cytochrome c oxidase subunit 2
LTVIRDRKRPDDIAPAPQFHGNTKLEVTWTVIPILLVIVLFGMTVQTMAAVAQPEARADDLNVRIVGHRWWWEYDYQDLGIVTANELHIPVGRVVQVSLESVDVIHSFWVPQLSGKTDVIPGQHNTMWLKGDKVGVFTGQCAEFCGTEHALMRIIVFVDSQADYDAWVANQLRAAPQPQTEDELAGYDTVANTCVSCHSINVGEVTDNAKSGPNLTHLFSRTTFAGSTYPLNEENLRRWLEDTQELKPDSNMQITLLPDEIDQIIAFLTLLK